MAASVIGVGDESFELEEEYAHHEEEEAEAENFEAPPEDEYAGLPQCKIKRNYACPQCSYFTQNPRFYLHHLKDTHKQKIRIYECPNCLYASKHSQKLHRHQQMVHSGSSYKRRVVHKSATKLHQQKKPKLPRREPSPKEFKEEELKEEEEAKEDFEDFEAVYNNKGKQKGRSFKCPIPNCSFQTRSESLIMRHEKVAHFKKRFFRCTKCNYVTHMKARYTKHVKYHSMPMIKCEQCDFKTPYKWNLDRHMKNHSSDGAFKCSLCNFTADIKQSLTVHEMNHHVPPVGHAMGVAVHKRKNRVGASDLEPPDPPPAEPDPQEFLRDQAQMQAFGDLSMLNEIEITKRIENPFKQKSQMKNPNPNKPAAFFSTKELTVKLGEKVVNPTYHIQQKNGNIYVKKLKCRVCNYRAAWDSEMTRHEQRVHGLGLEEKKSKQKSPRPIPNLIPIQNNPAQQTPPPPPPHSQSLSLHPPPLPILSQQSRPMMHQKPLMLDSQPHFQQNMNRNPFLPQHLQQMNFSISPTPQTHNLPHQYPQHLPSRFAQPKNVVQRQHMKPFPPNGHSPKSFQQKPSPPPPPILRIPTPSKARTATSSPVNSSPDKTMTEKDLNDICAKSCPTSALKDFASLMGGDEAFKSEKNVSQSKESTEMATKKGENSQDSINEAQSVEDGPKSPETMKKKNSFFDQLKEKFGAGESCNLFCNLCGYESKCLSESLRHQKTHKYPNSGISSGSGTVFSNADLSSTRCQYCRQRCKTSSDLLMHLKSCSEANKGTSEPINIDDEEEDQSKGEANEENRLEFEDGEGEDEFEDPDDPSAPHPMENRVFVWTNTANGEEDGLDDDFECGSQSPNSDCVFGVETAPGIGAVTSSNKNAGQSNPNTSEQGTPQKEPRPKPDNVKKVYKCPHCSFWASTASRFHVHIVGHLNKKPFECSLCFYRSNWRWDITKHIRLKTIRDSSHQRAKVLMTDETGRRNYSKYNKYLTVMRVHEPAAESSGSGQRGKKITQSFEPIETIPTPPKLTPAPNSGFQTNDNSNSPSNSASPNTINNQFRTIFPKPPPLQSSFDLKRKVPEDSKDEPPKKKGLLENKKTMWKCKKCLFRDSDRAVVLAHVKGHYRNQGQNQQDSSDEASDKPIGKRSSSDEPVVKRRSGLSEDGNPYMCGHCPQTSQWKHVIQRHCRLKHNGDVKVRLAPRQNAEEPEKNEEENETNNDVYSYMCETCPYVGNTQLGLDEHMEKHFERLGATLKCYFCPFFVSDKDDLMEHMSLHGEPDVDDNYSYKEEDSMSSYPSGGEGGEPFMNKRYRCTACPYVSNSKTQFLYHKQFHRPSGAPFQCHLCSYNVPRRHFLQQHLRLHGINTPLPKNKTADYMDAPLNIKEFDTSTMTEIPLVWVSKLGTLTKMFKCRWCPHVNIRKSNIQEHEKMHSVRTKTSAEGSSPLLQLQHHCPECNYVCNNAGVLSSHAKVHQGLFGQVCGLVDLTRTDEEQIKELNMLLGREEEGPPEITPDEINKDFKDASPQTLSTPEKDLDGAVDNRILHFCNICPARFLYPKELEIHLRFHHLQLQFQCDSCSYTARQQPHLLAHYKVHTDEYQDRTNALCEVYKISEEHPKPKIAVIVDGSEEVGPAWVVVERQKMPAKDSQNEYDLDEAPSETSQHGNRIVTKQFACERCPATFFKSIALQYHVTLHGSPNPHNCRVCDYAVKTYGNLIKHEAVHEDLEPRLKIKVKTKRPLDVPASGTELFKQKTEANQKVAAAPPPPPPLHIDPEFGILMHGSPEFVYPTYLKNGRLKEKRYKCHKCPSAFEKREQYKVHLSLHGSKQRYSCERCDYSVKYYANYIQHLRKHQSNDATRADRKLSTDKSAEDSTNEDGAEAPSDSPPVEEIIPQPPITGRSSKKIKLSMADQQATMLMQQRIISNSVSVPEVTNRCLHCPYSNQRKEGVGSHLKCHSNAKGGAFPCKYCDYTVPKLHFLREHNKLHFTPLKCNRPEAYMKCDRLELWAEPIVQSSDDKPIDEKPKKVLIFKDRGANMKENRFLPAYSLGETDFSEEELNEREYINLKTGEPETNSSPESNENSEKEDETEMEKPSPTLVLEIPQCSGVVGKTNEDAIEIKDEITAVVQSNIDDNFCSENQSIGDNCSENQIEGDDCSENQNDRDDCSENQNVEENNTEMEVDEPLAEENSPLKMEEDISENHLESMSTENMIMDEENCEVNVDNCNVMTNSDEDELLNEQDDNVADDGDEKSQLSETNFNSIAVDQESQESNVNEDTDVNESQDGSTKQQSDVESQEKSEAKGSSSGTSDSDTDSSSDSSSDDSQDSNSSSVTSSKQQ